MQPSSAFHYIEPEVAGGLGEGTEMDTAVHPPRVTRLQYRMESWLGDALLESFPVFVLTLEAAEAADRAGLGGMQTAEVDITRSPEFDEMRPGGALPPFIWLKVDGLAGRDDFGIAGDHRLVLSEAALETLRPFGIANALIEPFPDLWKASGRRNKMERFYSTHLARKRPMIDTLDALPPLTESWIEPLRREDPELHAELAESLVITPGGDREPADVPAGVGAVIGALDLRGKEIGAFRFAPIEGESASDQIAAYDQHVRQWFDASPDLVFLGDYGSGSIFASPQGIGLFDGEQQRIVALAPDFEGFLLAQANAYDAYKATLVQAQDRSAFELSEAQVAAAPRFAKVDVAAIFEAQRVS